MHRHVLSFAQCLALAIRGGHGGKKPQTSAFMFTLQLGSHAGVPAQPRRCLAQPLRWMLSPETAPPASPPAAWGWSHLHQ